MTKSELETVVLANLEKLYRVAKRMVSNPVEAEDLVGATLTTGFQLYDRCDGEFPVAWLVKIMLNHAKRTYRNDKRNGDLSLLDSVVDPSIHDKFMNCVHQVDITRALEDLPWEYREAVILCDIEEISYKEVAVVLEVPIGTVKSRLARGRKLLIAALAYE